MGIGNVEREGEHEWGGTESGTEERRGVVPHPKQKSVPLNFQKDQQRPWNRLDLAQSIWEHARHTSNCDTIATVIAQ